MRVGLVLGAGGVVGASWLIGLLEALAEQTGWDPCEADYIVGTSAGSVIGALTAGGLDPHAMAAFVRVEPVTELEEMEELVDVADRSNGTEYCLARTLPSLGPGSWRMAAATLRHPISHSAGALLSGWLPRGLMRNDPVRRLVERLVQEAWPQHPNYWAATCDYGSGRRVAFGREDAPPARVGDAVAASCAIPGFYQPVRIAGRSYVDGGVCSPSNLDLLCGRDLDLVICLNPISSRARVEVRGPADRVAAAVRAASGRRLGHEARKLRAEGRLSCCCSPPARTSRRWASTLMARNRRVEVIECARESVPGELEALRRGEVRLPGPPRRQRAA